MNAAIARLLDVLYPPKCAACDALVDAREVFCRVCAESLVPIGAPMCPRCGLPFAGGVDHLCSACAAHSPPFDRARAAFQYGGELQRAITRMKYGGRPDLARVLGPMLGAPPECDVVVAVPLGRRRLAEREYNQALLLARAAWPRVRIDAFALRRVRDTPPQAGLSAGARRASVRGAFVALGSRVEGRRVALVDDVLTTGATVEACARALRAAGAREVLVSTLARTVP
ncbi:MAG: ComF family protein [Myxococcota bacterium]